jgi:hypothetical protein
VDIEDINVTRYDGIPRAKLEEFAKTAAEATSTLCRNAIKANMARVGIDSNGLSVAIENGVAYFWAKRGVVRFRLPGDFNPYPKRSKQGGVWMIAAAQDAGRVIGIKAQAARAKRTIKAGLATAKTFGAVRQVHNGLPITREALKAGGITVVPGKKFWEFNAGQAAAIKATFLKNFNGLVARYLRRSR